MMKTTSSLTKTITSNKLLILGWCDLLVTNVSKYFTSHDVYRRPRATGKMFSEDSVWTAARKVFFLSFDWRKQVHTVSVLSIDLFRSILVFNLCCLMINYYSVGSLRRVQEGASFTLENTVNFWSCDICQTEPFKRD